MNPKDDRVVNPVVEILEQPAPRLRFLNSCQLNDLNKADMIEIKCALKNLNFDTGALRLFVMVTLVDKLENTCHIHSLKCSDNTIVSRAELFKIINPQIASDSFFFELDNLTKECQISGLVVVNTSMEELRESCAREVLRRRLTTTVQSAHESGGGVAAATYSQILDSLTESDQLVDQEIQTRLRLASNSNEVKIRLKVIIFNTINNSLDTFLTEPEYTNPIVNLNFNKSEFHPHKDGSKLKIVRSSRIGGRMQGNDELFLFCSSIDPSDIQVEFFQITEDAQISWRALGRLDRSDIHSNCSLVVYTPEYPVKPASSSDERSAPAEKVKVYYRLLKPSTREYSEKWVFYYFLKSNDDFVNLFSNYFSEEKFLRRYRHFLTYSAIEKTKSASSKGSISLPSSKRVKRKKIYKESSDSESKKTNDTVEMKDTDEAEIEAVSDTTDESDDESEETDDQVDDKTEPDSEMWTDQGDEVPSASASVTTVKPKKSKNKGKLKSLEALSTADINSNSNSPDSSLAKTTAKKLHISSTVTPSSSSSATTTTTTTTNTMDRTKFSLESLEGLDAKSLKENLASCITKMNGLAERSGKALIKFAKTRSLHELLKTQRFLLNHQDEAGNTPIHLCIIHGNLDILEIFVDIAMTIPYQNLINLKNSKHMTPLLLAAHLNEPNICEFLLEAKADITAVDSNGCNIVHIACKKKNLELLKVAIKHVEKSDHYETIDSINHDGYSPLHIAVMNKSKELTRELLYVKALKINMADRRTGMTALHHAAAFSDLLTICSLLVNNEAIEIDAKAYNGCTPLHVAVANKNYLIAALLIKHGANIYLQSDTPVHNDSELYHSAQRKYNTLRKVIENHVQTTAVRPAVTLEKTEMESESDRVAARPADQALNPFTFPDAKLSEEVFRAYEQETEREKSDEYSDSRIRTIPSQHNYDAQFYAQNDQWVRKRRPKSQPISSFHLFINFLSPGLILDVGDIQKSRQTEQKSAGEDHML